DGEAALLMAGVMEVHLRNGFLLDDMISRLEEETARDPAEATIEKREVAQILMSGGHTKLAKPFLPSMEEALEAKDYEGLDLLAQLYVALFQIDREEEHLEQAWTASHHILAAKEEVGDAEKESPENEDEDKKA